MMSIVLVSIWVAATIARLGIQDIKFLSIPIHSFSLHSLNSAVWWWVPREIPNPVLDATRIFIEYQNISTPSCIQLFKKSTCQGHRAFFSDNSHLLLLNTQESVWVKLNALFALDKMFEVITIATPSHPCVCVVFVFEWPTTKLVSSNVLRPTLSVDAPPPFAQL